MFTTRFLASLLFLTPTLASPLNTRTHPAPPDSYDDLTYNNHTIFQSPADYTAPGTLYARTVQLPDKSLLATWENYSPEPPPVYFPIYRSTDVGQTWTPIANVTDQSYGWGLRYQPFLYVLPEAMGGFDKHTLLLAGSSIPTDLSSTHIELYASKDAGHTWEFVSHIAAGGKAVPDNGLTPVWEPFLMYHQGQLICYYSDQRDPAYGQKLVLQATTDLKAWGAVVDIVRYDNYTARPGMPVIAQLHSGEYMMTYEYGGGPVDGNTTGPYQFPVHYKLSADPTSWDDMVGLPIVTNDAARVVPESSPYVVVDSKGLVIVSCGSLSDVFVSTNPADVGSWQSRYTGERSSYTRSLRLLKEGHGKECKEKLLLAGGGPTPPATMNKVTVGLVDVKGW